MDIRRTEEGRPSDYAIPGLNIEPPTGKSSGPEGETEARTPREGIGGWISNMVNRGRRRGKQGQQGQYSRVGQDEED